MALEVKTEKAQNEASDLESGIAGLKERLAETEAEANKLEREHQDAASHVAQARGEVQIGKPGGEGRYQEAIQEAARIEAKQRELALVQKGLRAELAAKETRLHQIREAEAQEIRNRQRADFQDHLERAKESAKNAVKGACEAYENAALRCGEALGAIEHLRATGGADGSYRAGQLLESLITGATPAALEMKGHKLDLELLRAPYGRFESRLLAIQPSAKE